MFERPVGTNARPQGRHPLLARPPGIFCCAKAPVLGTHFGAKARGGMVTGQIDTCITGTIISPGCPVIDHLGGNFAQRYSKALRLRNHLQKLLALSSFCCTPVYKKLLRLSEKKNYFFCLAGPGLLQCKYNLTHQQLVT